MSAAPSYEELMDELGVLRRQLEDAEGLAEAIRENRVDAFVVRPDDEERVLILQGCEHPYRRLVDCMQQGALTVTADGSIAYANPSLLKMLGRPSSELVGANLVSLVPAPLRPIVEQVLCDGRKSAGETEVLIWSADDTSFPAHITASPLADHGNTLCIIVTDLTLQKQQEADRARYLHEKNTLIEAEHVAAARHASVKLAKEDLERRVEERTAQLRDVTLELMQAEQRERKKLARVLHDDIQQLLAALKIAASRLPSQKNVKEAADGVLALADRSLEACRGLTIQLSPPVLHDGDFLTALNWLGNEMKVLHGLQVQIEADSAMPRLSEQIRFELFNIIRELLFNVVKHSGVDTAAVRFLVEDSSLRIEVADRGKGCSSEAAINRTKHDSFGLSSIRERLLMLGGQLKIKTAPGQGCTVDVTLPHAVLATKASPSQS